MHYAARRILELGARRAVLLGGMGGRLDHTLANFATLVFLTENGVDALLADETCEVRVLLQGVHRVPRREGCYLSLFPVGTSARVTLRNVFYTLESEVLSAGFPLGVSNEFLDGDAEIRVEEGSVYMLTAKRNPFDASCIRCIKTQRKRGRVMQIVTVKCPKWLAGIVRAVFGVK